MTPSQITKLSDLLKELDWNWKAAASDYHELMRKLRVGLDVPKSDVDDAWDAYNLAWGRLEGMAETLMCVDLMHAVLFSPNQEEGQKL